MYCRFWQSSSDRPRIMVRNYSWHQLPVLFIDSQLETNSHAMTIDVLCVELLLCHPHPCFWVSNLFWWNWNELIYGNLDQTMTANNLQISPAEDWRNFRHKSFDSPNRNTTVLCLHPLHNRFHLWRKEIRNYAKVFDNEIKTQGSVDKKRRARSGRWGKRSEESGYEVGGMIC